MSKTIFAFTETKSPVYPGYVNISELEGETVVTVRGPSSNRGESIKLTEVEAVEMVKALNEHFASKLSKGKK